MEEQNNNNLQNPKTYEGELFDVVVTNQAQADLQKIERLTSPEYQREVCREAVGWMNEHYGETFEQLKYL